ATRIHTLSATDDGAVWIGTERGVLRWTAEGIARVGGGEGLPDDHVLSLAPSRDGSVWVGTRSGVARVRAQGTTLIAEAMAPGQGWPASPVLSLLEDPAGALWIGLDQDGLVRHFQGRFEALGVDGGLPNGRVKALLLDHEGSLWLGIENGGLARLRDGAFSTLTTEDGLTGDIALTVFEDPRGRLWAGTYDGGLHRVRRRGPDLAASVERRFETAVSSLAGRGAEVWVGTLGEGLHRRSGAGDWPAFGVEDGLPSPAIYALYVGAAGDFWVGTDQGLARYAGGRFSVLTTEDGLSSDVITTVLQTRDGTLWVGTYDGGLNRITDGETTTYGDDVLGSNVVTALYEDADGALWIATFGGGLTRYADGAFFTFTPRHGLYDDKLYQVFEDEAGQLWMGCNKGIFRLPRAQLNAVAAGSDALLSPVVYDEDDGLRSREVNGGVQPAGWSSRDGRLWFPTTDGIAFVAPGELRRNSTPPPVVIEEVRVERVPVVPSPGETLRVPAGTDHLDFDFAALSLADPEAVRYRYRLDGFEDEWSAPTNRRQASYTALDPGPYTFRVAAMNADGVWNEEGAALSLYLRPFFWQTVWFWLLIGVAAVGGGTGVYRLRVRHLTQRQRELEREVAARTSDLRDALDEKEVLLREIHHRVKNN
ncbi:MAG: two-component regulator propeller domain-containing protein, partial [Bacteroidota bacterium]